MPRQRSTVRIFDLLGTVNAMLATSTCVPAGRAGMAAVLEKVLMESGQYAGFRCLTQDEVPEGQLPGIRDLDPNATYDRATSRYTDGRFDFTDETRRCYY